MASASARDLGRTSSAVAVTAASMLNTANNIRLVLFMHSSTDLSVANPSNAFNVGVGNSFSTLSDNNFLGNDRKRAALLFGVGLYFSPSFSPGPSAHCSILNLGVLEALYGPSEVTPSPATIN